MSGASQVLQLTDPLPLDGGSELAQAEIAYETYGTLY